MSVPYRQRSWADIRPTEAMKQMADDKQFYQLYFQNHARLKLIESVQGPNNPQDENRKKIRGIRFLN
jgi:hypothetical protein